MQMCLGEVKVQLMIIMILLTGGSLFSNGRLIFFSAYYPVTTIFLFLTNDSKPVTPQPPYSMVYYTSVLDPGDLRLFSSPVRSTRRAIVVTLVVRVCVPITLRQNIICKFSKSSYLDSHSSESIHIWTTGTLEGLL